MIWQYIKRDSKKIEHWFNSKVKKGVSGFNDYQEFLNWYSQDKVRP